MQWLALAVAQILVGFVGGYVSQHELQQPMFVGCGLLALFSLVGLLERLAMPWLTPEPQQQVAV